MLRPVYSQVVVLGMGNKVFNEVARRHGIDLVSAYPGWGLS